MIEHIVPTESRGRKKLTLSEDKDNYYITNFILTI